MLFCSFSFVCSSIANQISDFYFKMQLPLLSEYFESKKKIVLETQLCRSGSRIPLWWNQEDANASMLSKISPNPNPMKLKKFYFFGETVITKLAMLILSVHYEPLKGN